MASPLTFEDRVQVLPPELFDEIHSLVFSVTASNELTIDQTYKPPVQLHVSKAPREGFAKAYYKFTRFEFPNALIMAKWILSLERQHRMLLRSAFLNIKWYRQPIEIGISQDTGEPILDYDPVDEVNDLDFRTLEELFEDLGVRRMTICKWMLYEKFECLRAGEVLMKTAQLLERTGEQSAKMVSCWETWAP